MSDNSLENIELRSDEVQEILTKVPRWMIRWGSLVFLILIAIILLISWLVKYPDVIPSDAIITTSIPPEKEYAKITGRIAAIFVEDNQAIESNTPLAVLENTANHQDVFKLQTVVDTITVNSKSFSFPFDSMPLLFLGEIESEYILFENNYLQYQLNQELKPFSNQALANRYAITELNNRLQNLKSQRDINKTELKFARNDLERQQTLFDQGVISEQEYENKQLLFAQAERNYKNFEASISQIREAISNAEMTSRGTEISRVREELILLKNVIQSFNQLKKAIKDWERMYVLKSGMKGRVSFLNFWSVNQTVNQGDLVFTIIPSEDLTFVAKLKTPSQNSGKIKVGQKVNIKLENYPDAEFGMLNGTVKNISLIPDKDGFYYVDVELPQKLVTSYKKEIEFKQEMRGMAEIITEDLRLAERLFYQFNEVMRR